MHRIRCIDAPDNKCILRNGRLGCTAEQGSTKYESCDLLAVFEHTTAPLKNSVVTLNVMLMIEQYAEKPLNKILQRLFIDYPYRYRLCCSTP